MLYYIDTHYACFGIIEERGVVINAAPIAGWAIAHSIDEVLHYYKTKKKAIIIKCA